MAEVIRAGVKGHENNDRAAAEVLFALVDGDDKYEEHLQAVEEESVSTSAGNTFKIPLTNEYGDMDADAGLVNTFDSLVSTPITMTPHV